MTILQSVLLGILQGATEFLPVSSTAHLAVVPWLLGWSLDPELAFAFDVLVQLGTLLAVILFFWRDVCLLFMAGLKSLRERSLKDPNARIAWLLVLATIPGAIAGLALKEIISSSLQEPIVIGIFLLATAFLLFLAGRRKTTRDLNGMRSWDALWIGLGQVVALFPGASRSGWTMGAGLLRGIERVSATRFAFLMAIPIMLGAGLVEILDLLNTPALIANLDIILIGFICAAITGFLAIAWLFRFLKNHSLDLFAGYCFLAGSAVILIRLVRG